MGYEAASSSQNDSRNPGPARTLRAGPSPSAAELLDMSEVRIRNLRLALHRPPPDKDAALRGALADLAVIMSMVAQARPVEDIFAEVQEAKRRIAEGLRGT